MGNILIDAADAVVTTLNGAELSREFTAVRSYRPLYSPADLDTLRVTVVPKRLKNALIGRAQIVNEIAVDVGVQQHVPPSDTQQTTLDGLMQLVAEIEALFHCQRLASLPAVLWVHSEFAPAYSFEQLDLHHVFTAVLTLTFKAGG